jgi:iron complex outermembrane receptor protein
MSVIQITGSDYRVNYHGTNVLNPRRMNVLIDGVSAYQPLLARIDWANLPIAIDDIDRIEVTRGPDSAAYGPNSMLAIINILSKDPKDVDRGYASVSQGSNGISSATVRGGAVIGSFNVRLTASHNAAHGYDSLSRAGGNHDSTRMNRLNFRAQTSLGTDTTLDINGGYAHGIEEVQSVSNSDASFPDARPTDTFLSSTINHTLSPTHEVLARASIWTDRVRQTWRSCQPAAALLPELFNLYQANPSYANALLAGKLPSGGSPTDAALFSLAAAAIKSLGTSAAAQVCGTPNQNLFQRRIDAELQDTRIYSDRLRLVSGAGLRQNSGFSATYLGANSDEQSWRLFGNAEFKPTSTIVLNAGAYVEHDSLSGSSFSPRLAINYRLTANQTARLAWSRGSRSPDVQEQRADWSYAVPDAMPQLNGASSVRLYQSARSPGGLRSERINSIELGYLATIPAYGLLVDVKAFEDKLTQLISEKLQLADFQPTNSGSVRLSGVELQAAAEVSSEWRIFLNYAYLRNYATTTPLERTQYSRNSGSTGVWHRLPEGWSGALSYVGSSGNGLGQTSYGKIDATVSKALRLGRSPALVQLTLSRLDTPTQTVFRDFGAGNTLSSSYRSRMQYLAQITMGF